MDEIKRVIIDLRDSPDLEKEWVIMDVKHTCKNIIGMLWKGDCMRFMNNYFSKGTNGGSGNMPLGYSCVF